MVLRMKNIVSRILAKSRSLPTDLPLNDSISPVKEYIGTSGVYWKIYRASLLVTDAVSILTLRTCISFSSTSHTFKR